MTTIREFRDTISKIIRENPEIAGYSVLVNLGTETDWLFLDAINLDESKMDSGRDGGSIIIEVRRRQAKVSH